MQNDSMLNYREPYLFEFLNCYTPEGTISQYFYAANGAKEARVMPPLPDEPNKLYHYCSFESFSNILLNRKIWLTPLSNMNDKKEITWFLELLKKQILSSHKNKHQIQLYFMLQEIIKLNLDDAYASCYTTLCDDFGKWELYGDNQKGICFEINPKILPITRDLPLKVADGEQILNSCAFLKVNYNHQQQQDAISNVLNSLAKDNKVYEYANYLSKVAYFCKRKNFKTEREWRILYSPKVKLENNREITDFNNFTISSIKTHKKNDTIIKHFEIPLLNGFITKIIIGSNSQINIEDVNNLIVKSGLDIQKYPIEITYSEI